MDGSRISLTVIFSGQVDLLKGDCSPPCGEVEGVGIHPRALNGRGGSKRTHPHNDATIGDKAPPSLATNCKRESSRFVLGLSVTELGRIGIMKLQSLNMRGALTFALLCDPAPGPNLSAVLNTSSFAK